MLVHNVTVRGRTSHIDGIDLVQGTVGMDYLSLDLDDEWDGLDIVVALGGSGERIAPARLGGGSGGDVLRTIDLPTAFRVLPSTSVYGAQSPSDPTLTQWREAYEKALSSRVDSIEVTTLPPGSTATAQFGDHVLSLGIPQGKQGRSVRLYPGDDVVDIAEEGDVAINPDTGDIFIWE